jgi:hypothetical protein
LDQAASEDKGFLRHYGKCCENSDMVIAVSLYVLVAIVKKRLNLDRSLYSILQIMNLSLLEKIPISQALSGIDDIDNRDEIFNQLKLFN